MPHSHQSTSPLWPGVPLAIASATLFGASAPLSKLLTVSIGPQLLAGILYLGAGFGLAMLTVLRRLTGRPNAEAGLRRGDLPWLAAVVLFGGMLGPVLLMFGLSQTSASSGSLLLNLEGLATMALAWLVFRENVDRWLMLGALAILAGAVVLSWTSSGLRLDPCGLLIAAACLCWGIDNNLSRKLSHADPVLVAMIKGVAAGSTNIVLALGLGAALPSPGLALGGAAVGFAGIGLSLVGFMLALRHLGTARTGAYFSVAPFIGAVLGMVMFQESLTPQLVIAAALMGVGLWLHLSERHDHDHSHDAQEHEHAHVHDAHHRHHSEAVVGPHVHPHVHNALHHRHAHFPDLHHRHDHN